MKRTWGKKKHCWAITWAMGQSCCGHSSSSVLEFVHTYIPITGHIALWRQQCDNPEFAIWISYYDWTAKYNNHVRQHRHTCYLKHTLLDAIIVGYSCYIYELKRSINSKWHNFWIVPLLGSVSDMYLYTEFRLAQNSTCARSSGKQLLVSRGVYIACVLKKLIRHIPHMCGCRTR